MESLSPHPSIKGRYSPFGWKILGALPVGVFLALLIIVKLQGSTANYESPDLLAILNTLFLSAMPLFVAYLAARSSQTTGVLGFLMVGCGLVFFGVASLYAGWVMPLADGSNPAVTVHNLGSLAGGLCVGIGAELLLLEALGISTTKVKHPPIWIIYAGIAGLVTALALLAFRGSLPVFFDPLTGASPLRQVILGGAIVLFILAGLLFGHMFLMVRNEFSYWFGLGLLLIAEGLIGVLVQPSVGSILGWTGRGAQYIGSVYLILAFLYGRREFAAVQSGSPARQSWTLWPFLEQQVNHKIAALTQLNASLQAEITERKQAEESLRESEEKWHSLVSASPDFIALHDPEGRYLFMNHYAEGFSEKDVIGASIYQFISPEYKELFRSKIEQALATWAPQLFEYTALGDRGAIRTYEEYLVPMHTQNQETIFLAVARDITGRKQAEEALRRSEAQMRQAARLAKLGFWEWDVATDHVSFSDEMFPIYGITPEEFSGRGQDYINFTLPEDRPIQLSNIRKDFEAAGMRAHETGERIDVHPDPKEFRIRRKDGAVRWVAGDAVEVVDEQGKPVRMYGILQDISERKRAEQELQANENKYRTLVENIQIGVVAHAADTQIIFSNSRASEMLGLTPDQMRGKTAIDPAWYFIREDGTRMPLEEYPVTRALASDTPVSNLILGIIRPDREEVIWVQCNGHQERDLDGRLQQIVISFADITKRKQAERASRKSEAQLLSAIEASGLCLYEEEGTENTGRVMSFLDERGPVLLGIPNDQRFRARDYWIEHTYPEDLQQILVPAINRFEYSGEDNVYAEYRYLNQKRGIIWIRHAAIALQRNTHGDVLRLVGAVQDITERKQAEINLRESEKRYRSLFENMLEGYAYCQMVYEDGQPVDFIYLQTNPMFEELTGAKGIINRKVTDIIPGVRSTNPELFEIYGRVASKGIPEQFETYLPSLEKWLSIAAYSQQKGYFITVFSDITARKNKESETHELNRMLEARVAQRTQQLEAANQEMEAFTYSVSHDLRSPLRAINGYTTILLEDYAPRLDAEGQRILEIVRGSAVKMDHLTKDLLALSRMGRAELKSTRVDMTALAQAVYQEVASPEVQQKFTFTVSDLPAAYGDLNLLHQVWTNLLSNAIKFTLPQDERRIEVGAYHENKTNVYTVKDSGVGFNPANAQNLFGVFQRLHKAEDFEGTGVGLAIVQRIVQRHGGRVWAESQVGQGATFYFALPETPEIGPG